MTWYDTNYKFKKQITLDHTKVGSSDSASFPVLIARTDANLKTVGNGGSVQNSSGFDIIFVDSTETTKLDHEIEHYVATTGEIEMWVRIPTLSHTADTIIYCYYDNSTVSSSQENATGVWDSNFKAVYHLSDNAASTTVKESTSNANTGTAAANTSTKTTSGQIASGLSFNGSSDTITHSSFALGATTLTISAWVYSTNFVQNGMIAEVHPVNGTWEFFFEIGNFGGNALKLRGASAGSQVSATLPSNSAWHLVHGVISGTTGTIYIDGSSSATSTVSAIPSTTDTLNIGCYDGTGYFFTGTIDELRISNTNRSSDWITAEWNNQNNPSTFISVGSAQAAPATHLLMCDGMGGVFS